MGLLCSYIAGQVVQLMIGSWRDYREWCWLYVQVDIQGRRASDNTEQETTVTAWELTTSTPRDVLLVALAIHHQVQQAIQALETYPDETRRMVISTLLGAVEFSEEQMMVWAERLAPRTSSEQRPAACKP